jgi:thioredoxin-dependent peroxiredoxin
MMKKALWMLSLAMTIVGGLLSAKPALAQELKAGDPAPDFNLPGTDGKTYSLAGLKGKALVLAWFPKAFTGG